MAYIIYHNPRCTKSRQGLAYLKENGIEPEIKDYLKEGLSAAELKKVVKLLGIKPEALLRKTEAEFKEHFKGKNLTDDEWIEAMVAYPKLIQRPIVIHGDKAVVARPTELIQEIL
jgi:arsenate reductase (glutaredoxin)